MNDSIDSLLADHFIIQINWLQRDSKPQPFSS